MLRRWGRLCLGFALLACDDGGGAGAADAGPDALEGGDAAPWCATLHACSDRPPPSFSDPVQIVPADGLPPEIVSQTAHNNLDVIRFGDRLFFAFRTAPNHFASRRTVIYVMSTVDQIEWRYEGAFSADRDLREPRFGVVGGRLHLYYALLGEDAGAFEPGGTRLVVYVGPGDWTEPAPVFAEGFIPWRVHARADGGLEVIGYTGGEGVYDPNSDPVRVYWLKSQDGVAWDPVGPAPIILEGGVSEADYARLADGRVVLVGRNEAGDDDGFGSKICVAADDQRPFECATDGRKYDSPQILTQGDAVYLIARRHLSEDGRYDLGRTDLTRAEQWAQNQLAYWNEPKRCALWTVDPDARTVAFVLDLPSAGDTCFPTAIPLGGRQHLLYNYSSPFDRADITWRQGQLSTTLIYRTTLTLP